MKILLTGDSGDLGHVLAKPLVLQGEMSVNFDIKEPVGERGIFINGSILDRKLLQQSMEGVECIVHIAAWQFGKEGPPKPDP